MTDLDLPAELVAAPPAIASVLDEALLIGRPDGDTRDLGVWGWWPTTLDEAEWCMRRLAALRARDAEVVAQADVWKERVSSWERDERRRLAGGLAFFEERLRVYGLVRRAEDERNNKTTRLPSGRIKTTGPTGPPVPKVVVEDEAALLAWCESGALTDEEHEQVVKIETSVRLSQLREIVAVVERPVVRTPSEWEEVSGVVVLDPDGWRGKDEMPWSEPIEWSDFARRAAISTTNGAFGYATPPEATIHFVSHPGSGERVPGVTIVWPDASPTAKVEVD